MTARRQIMSPAVRADHRNIWRDFWRGCLMAVAYWNWVAVRAAMHMR